MVRSAIEAHEGFFSATPEMAWSRHATAVLLHRRVGRPEITENERHVVREAAGGRPATTSKPPRQKGSSVTARTLSRYFADQGLSTYSHVTDQHAVFGTKVIVATEWQAPYVLDEMLGNQIDLPITEHSTDSRGASLINFALFDLVGLQLSSRIRDLGKFTLHRLGSHAATVDAYPHAGPLLSRR